MNDVSNISDINYGLKDETGVLSHIKGKIEFENVCFNYPSNPDLKVLKNLTVTFEAG